MFGLFSRFFCSLLICCFFSDLQAQKFPLRLSAAVGPVAYIGDLGPAAEKLTPSFALLFSSEGESPLQLRFGLEAGYFEGENRNFNPLRQENNFFRTDFMAGTLGITYDFWQKGPWKAYASGQFGVMFFTVKDRFNQDLRALASSRLPGENYGKTTPFLLPGAGFTYLFPNRIGFGAELNYYWTMSDYLDNIGRLGNRSGNDSALGLRFVFSFPLLLNLSGKE